MAPGLFGVYAAPEARDLPLGAKHPVPDDLLFLVSSSQGILVFSNPSM